MKDPAVLLMKRLGHEGGGKISYGILDAVVVRTGRIVEKKRERTAFGCWLDLFRWESNNALLQGCIGAVCSSHLKWTKEAYNRPQCARWFTN